MMRGMQTLEASRPHFQRDRQVDDPKPSILKVIKRLRLVGGNTGIEKQRTCAGLLNSLGSGYCCRIDAPCRPADKCR